MRKKTLKAALEALMKHCAILQIENENFKAKVKLVNAECAHLWKGAVCLKCGEDVGEHYAGD